MNSSAHPAWYGAVMGTGALSLAFATESTTWDAAWLMTLAVIMLIAASMLAIALLPRYLRRLRDRLALLKEMSLPGAGPMLATLPAGILVLSADWGRVGPEVIPAGAALTVCAVLVVIGAVTALGFGLLWFTEIVAAKPALEAVNGGWMIPPVMNLIVPLGLTPLIQAHPSAAPLLIVIGFAFYGIGAILFLAVLALLVARLALCEPVAPMMAASLWIPLAPSGLIGLSMVKLLQSAESTDVPFVQGIELGVIVSAIGIGLGLWWAAFAYIELRRLRRQGPLPVQPGWWGFVFPIGTMTLSITTMALVTGVTALEVAGAVSTGILLLVWAYVGVRVIAAARRPSAAH
ncbi:MAG: hypothetical protein RL205_52 [Actinomycetota bacterium]|jgi:tellurite resistance protein TehA-like permease